MAAIGRILTVLLAATYTKNVFAMNAVNMKFSRDGNKIARSYNVTKLELISEPTALNADIESLWNILVNAFKSEPVQEIELEESRTFGNKRIQFMLMPMVYKMGVMMTMLMLITVLAAKGLLVGIILLIFKFSTFLAKLHSGWHIPHSWQSSAQPVHVHLHSTFPHIHPQIYQSWDSPSGIYDDQYYYKG